MARTSKKVEKAAPSVVDPESLVDGQEEELAELLAMVEHQAVRPVVTKLPPNFRLVLCDVGPHKNVRVMVRPNNKNYLPRMEIPLDVDLDTFNPNDLLIYNGNPPRRKGLW